MPDGPGRVDGTPAHDAYDDGGENREWVFEAVASIGDGLVVFDEKVRIVYHNPAATHLVGLHSSRTDSERWPDDIELFLPDETTPFPKTSNPLYRALSGDDASDVAMFVRHVARPSGIHVVVSSRALHDSEGKIRGAVLLVKDTTQLHEEHASLREAERQKSFIFDSMPDRMWLKDETGRYLVVNRRFAEAAGKTGPGEIVGLTDGDLWPPEIAKRYRADDLDVMKLGSRLRTEEPLVDSSGARRWMETVKARVVDDTGKVIGTTGISYDITERMRAEQDLRLARDELEQRVQQRTLELAEAQENLVRQERLAVLGQLAGGVAHQIRNPLAAIMNATYVLKRHLLPNQHQNVDDAIHIIHDEVRHANIIITGLLDYARVRTPDRHPASIVDLINRILEAEWIPSSIRIVRDLPAQDSIVREVDADQLEGAISNLVRNAIDAMPDGGELHVSLDVEDTELRITISDTGSGVSSQVRAHLFEPLHSTKPMGLGLGLVTARRFIEAHGGTITCVDVPRGARFVIRLPKT